MAGGLVSSWKGAVLALIRDVRGGVTVPLMVRAATATALREHAPHNAMQDAGEIARFHDRCSDLMRELLDALAAVPDRPRPFPEIEDAIGWPHRRIASVLGGVARLRQIEFGGRRALSLPRCPTRWLRPLGDVDGWSPGTSRPRGRPKISRAERPHNRIGRCSGIR
jgi:hypothetical protein